LIKKINIINSKLAEDVLKIQIPSYKVEAELIDFYEIPPLNDTVNTLQQCGETFYGYYLNDELSGVISIKVEKGVMDIHRLMVHPKHFRKGIARMLLEFIESNEEDFETIIVSTGTKNAPAINFYEKSGFSITEETRVTERLSLTSFKKKIK
jgi:ribosomal protein S18 acetylase RimI-like enzyme